MLYTKCIYEPPSTEDGVRISIMSRHTLDDGKTPDEKITPNLYQDHKSTLAPLPTLLGDYYKRGLPWVEFEKRFKEYLGEEKQREALEEIIRMASEQNVTLLCKEDTPEHCHRRLVAEKIKEMAPNIEVIIH